ncbi:hypothetical protein Btru_053661 [Bulinus truncatus]|nr:hypothetical protein Btru_053661 [Bulinus truncatus]
MIHGHGQDFNLQHSIVHLSACPNLTEDVNVETGLGRSGRSVGLVRYHTTSGWYNITGCQVDKLSQTNGCYHRLTGLSQTNGETERERAREREREGGGEMFVKETEK